MTRTSRRSALLRYLAVAFCLWAVPLFSDTATAQSLDALRATGALGERYDGLVAVRQPGAEANRIAAEVNAQRQAIYRQRATEQGVAWEAVGSVYARQIYDQAPKGTWFQTERGWVQK